MLAAEKTENVLLKRLLFTLGVIVVFRLGVHVPVPGVNTKALVELANSGQQGLLKMLNLFSGGALGRFSVFGLGIMPYISASIIVQLMTVVLPALEQMQKEGGVGRQKLNRVTRLLAVVLALVQGFFFASGLESAPETAAGAAVLTPGLGFRMLASLLLTGGTIFVMWLGEQITEKGLGNGTSLLIFAGIVASFPSGMGVVINAVRENSISVLVAAFIVLSLALMVFGIAFVEQSYRKIPINYAKRVSGNRVMGGMASFLPLKVNMAGVIPPIFASTLLAVPATLGGFSGNSRNLWLDTLMPNQWLYVTLFALLVLFFGFFYTSVTFKPDDVAENLKRQNAYIPGVRPGTETSEAVSELVTKLTLVGALYMNVVCLLPSMVDYTSGFQLMVGGTSVLIVVSVGLETIRQVSAQIANKKYDVLFFG